MYEIQRNYKGQNNPAYKDGRTLKAHYCILCGKNKIDYYSQTHICRECYNKLRRINKISRNYCCKDCGNLISSVTALYGKGMCIRCSNTGKNNSMYNVHRFGTTSPRYIDGRTKIKYPSIFNKKLKEKIRKRDNYICQNCKLSQIKSLEQYHEVLHVHHIDYNKEYCKENNLITLCRICNIKANTNRDYWYSFYCYIIKEFIYGK